MSSDREPTAKIDRNIWKFYEDAAGKWRWHCRDINGDILFNSSQGYAHLGDAQKCARRAGWTEESETEK